MSVKHARRNGCGDMLFGGCWPIHRGLSAAMAAWGEPARLYMRTFSGICTSLPSRGSVCVIEPWRSQYSLLVLKCTTRGFVSGRFNKLWTVHEDRSRHGDTVKGYD